MFANGRPTIVRYAGEPGVSDESRGILYWKHEIVFFPKHYNNTGFTSTLPLFTSTLQRTTQEWYRLLRQDSICTEAKRTFV